MLRDHVWKRGLAERMHWQMSRALRTRRGGWSRGPVTAIAFVALFVAAMLWIPATFGSGCGSDPDNCGPYEGAQIAGRAVVAFAPFWLLAIALLGFRFRSALIVFAVAALAMAGFAATLGSDLRFALRPFGLSTAAGFVAYSIPLAVAGVAALLDVWRSGESSRSRLGPS
jgi:hypothetical protein